LEGLKKVRASSSGSNISRRASSASVAFADALKYEAERDEAEVAVDDARARLLFERLGRNRVEHALGAAVGKM
jgi:hypothetical protein